MAESGDRNFLALVWSFSSCSLVSNCNKSLIKTANEVMLELWTTGWHLLLNRAIQHICNEPARSSSSTQSFSRSQSLSVKSKSFRANSWKVRWAIDPSAKVQSFASSLLSSSSTTGGNTLLELSLVKNPSICETTVFSLTAASGGQG